MKPLPLVSTKQTTMKIQKANQRLFTGLLIEEMFKSRGFFRWENAPSHINHVPTRLYVIQQHVDRFYEEMGNREFPHYYDELRELVYDYYRYDYWQGLDVY